MRTAAVATAGIRASQAQWGRQTAKSSSLLAASRWQQHHHRRTSILATQHLHTAVGGPWDDQRRNDQEKKRVQFQLSSLPTVAQFHATPQSERAAAIALGFGALSALAYAGSSAVKAYNEYKASLPTEEELEEQRKQQEKEAGAQQEAKRQQEEAQASAKSTSKDGKRENIFAQWFGVGVGAKYYEGGFEDEMTRREAALILGVRESSPASRIKEAHRKLLVLNHPGMYFFCLFLFGILSHKIPFTIILILPFSYKLDTGGSTYVSLKINEAKELLLKGKRS